MIKRYISSKVNHTYSFIGALITIIMENFERTIRVPYLIEFGPKMKNKLTKVITF